MGRRDRFLLSSVLALLAVASVIAVMWLGSVDHTTSLAEYDPNGVADTYKSDATEKDSYIVVECWSGTLGVPAADSEPCQKKMHDLDTSAGMRGRASMTSPRRQDPGKRSDADPYAFRPACLRTVEEKGAELRTVEEKGAECSHAVLHPMYGFYSTSRNELRFQQLSTSRHPSLGST
eukprot:2641078-Rhodomonas_salina.1